MASVSTASMPDLARQVWRLLDSKQRRECVLVLVITVIAGCFTLMGVAGIAPFLAVIADPTVVERNAALAWLERTLALESSQAFVVWLGVGFVSLLVVSNVVTFFSILAIGRFSQHVGARLHVLLFDEYLQRDLRFHAQSNSAMLESHVVSDVTRTVGGVVQSGLMLVAGAVSIGLITAAVVIVDPVTALGAAVLLGTSYVGIYSLVRRRLMSNGAITTQLWGKRAKVVAESLAAIKDIIIFRAQREMVARVARHSKEIARALASTSAIAASPRFVLECAMAAGLVATALWIYSGVGPGQWLSHLAFLGLAAYRLLPAIQQVFTAAARIRSDRASFDRIADDLSRARQRVPGQPGATSAEWSGRPRRGIRVANVSYQHSPERRGGVEAISLYIPAGALVGFVGSNGSGKTTLADLVLGLLRPSSGSIEIDGEPLDDGNREAWLSAVAYVPQHIVLLDATVAQNIAFGIAPEDIDTERVREAAQLARLNEVVEGMPGGLATQIGQNGVQLSGGQRQRIGIARALYRRASLMVMDEATHSLDALAESKVIALLAALRGSCTTILIAHRLSALTHCDTVFELDRGRLVAQRALTELASSSSGAPRLAELR